jgi:hypothetical protein
VCTSCVKIKCLDMIVTVRVIIIIINVSKYVILPDGKMCMNSTNKKLLVTNNIVLTIMSR